MSAWTVDLGFIPILQLAIGKSMHWSWWQSFKFRDEVIIRTAKHQVSLPNLGKIEVCIEVNCLGATCPRPQMLAMKAFACLAPGEVMEIVSDNPSSVEALQALALNIDARYLAQQREANTWRLYLGKAPETGANE